MGAIGVFAIGVVAIGGVKGPGGVKGRIGVAVGAGVAGRAGVKERGAVAGAGARDCTGVAPRWKLDDTIPDDDGVTATGKVPAAMAITPPHTEHRARTPVAGTLPGSTRNTEWQSGQETVMCQPDRFANRIGHA